MNKQTNKQKT